MIINVSKTEQCPTELLGSNNFHDSRRPPYWIIYVQLGGPNMTVMCFVICSRDEIILGIPMGPVGPMGFPWEWESIG